RDLLEGRREARLLRDDGRVDVADREPRRAHARDHAREDLAARDARERRVRGREVAAEVALAERAEEGARDRVQEHVAIGVALEAARVRGPSAAEPQRAPRDPPGRGEAPPRPHAPAPPPPRRPPPARAASPGAATL